MGGYSVDGGSGDTAHDMRETLAARVTGDRHDRVVCALLAAVRHLHDLVGELRPSPDEWRDVIAFITEVGHAADARRQEWVLLSDVIGASTLIEDLHTPRPAGATPNTLAGPFYRAGVPEMQNGANISRDGIGSPLQVAGRITALGGQSVARAVVEVWQANSFGVYENQHPDQQPEFNLRGCFVTDAEGAFGFSTICPRGYALPEDGPVGRLLNKIGVKLERPAHLHFKVTAPGFQTLTTHVYDRTDPAIGRDALFCVKPDLLAEFRPVADDHGPAHRLDVRFVMARMDQTLPASPANNPRKE